MKSNDTTNRAGRSKLVALALTVALVLGGCVSSTPPPDPVRIGSAPATPTGKINFALPKDPSGFFVFNRWPNACDLLTDQDVRAVFPQARDIRRKPDEQKRKIVGNLLSRVGTGPGRDVAVKNAYCDVAFSLAGAEPKFSDGYQMSVNIDYAGTEAVVRDNQDRGLKGDTRARLAGADCTFSSAGGSSCVKGQLAFSLSARGFNQAQKDQKFRVRYQVGAEVTSFGPEESGPKGYKALTKFENDHIGSELVKAVASKI